MYMARMIRKQVYLGAAQERRLKQIAARRGVTEAAVIREAIERLGEAPAARRGAAADPLAFARRLLAAGPLPPQARDWTRDAIHQRREPRG
jgi:hypothetical protein